NGTPAARVFDDLAYNLANGTEDQIEVARTGLRDDHALSVDAFNRLQEIRNKDRRWVRTAGSDRLSLADRRELASILVQCIKQRFLGDWSVEEGFRAHAEPQLRFDFGPEEFWFAERDPVEGEWPPVRQEWAPQGDVPGGRPAVREAPWIDPELITRKELPGWRVAGGRALELWKSRRDALTSQRISFRADREARGLDAALARALV